MNHRESHSEWVIGRANLNEWYFSQHSLFIHVPSRILQEGSPHVYPQFQNWVIISFYSVVATWSTPMRGSLIQNATWNAYESYVCVSHRKCAWVIGRVILNEWYPSLIQNATWNTYESGIPIVRDTTHSELLFRWLMCHDSSDYACAMTVLNEPCCGRYLSFRMTPLMTLFWGPWLFGMTHSEESWHIWTSHVALTRHIHTCDMTHSHTWQNSVIWVTWLIRTRHMSHLSAWRDSFICAT